ncbi:HNH endonuclease [Marinobacterium sp. BA1]|uniref:HNH endonuclease n=1 Tax=Marinobacterium sp. BA1 TaxID=3138931 RepID=UPI0032E5FFC2
MRMDDLSEAQRWFLEHAGKTLPWSTISANRPRLTTQAKGIYKPADSEYALSVKETLSGDYPDKEPIYRDDGSWLYEYFQENSDPTQRDAEYTNRALMKCIHDGVPVGVMIQTKPKPGVEYRIMGLAYVTGWDEGYFYLESYDSDRAFNPGPRAEIERITQQLEINEETGSYNPDNVSDSRKKIIASIVQRRGQAKFRAQLIEAYRGYCAITGCDTIPALEAAHITPYKGDDSNATANGLLLRADIHTLWDLGMIAVDPDTGTVVIAEELRGSYSQIEGATLAEPVDGSDRPSKAALSAHIVWTGLKT